MRRRFRSTVPKLTFREPCPVMLTATQTVTARTVTAIAALSPTPSYVRASAPTGVGKLRQMLASDAIAVRPIQPIPDEQQRRRRQESENSVGSSTGSDTPDTPQTELRQVRGLFGDEVGGRAPASSPDVGGQRVGDGFRTDLRSTSTTQQQGAARPRSAASPTTGFLTQTIAQEAMGAGLHIEPWNAAITAYRRAAAAPRESLVSNVSI